MNSAPKISRLFVAIALPEALRAKLAEVQRELQAVLPGNTAVWPKPENLHLTLRFLGNVESSRIPALAENLSTTLTCFGELDLFCERLGCFPDLGHPRVVWAWVYEDMERLTQLFPRIDEAVSGFAEKPAEPRFIGHITLARLRQIQRADAERLAKFIDGATVRRFGDWRASAVELIRSDLSPQASARYETVFRASLL